jgi:hypothetical protein
MPVPMPAPVPMPVTYQVAPPVDANGQVMYQVAAPVSVDTAAPVAAPVVQVPMTVSTPASINSPTMMTPTMMQPSMMPPSMMKPTMMKPTMMKPTMIKTVTKPMAASVSQLSPAKPYICPEGFKQVSTDAFNGSCTAPCVPGNASPKSFNYGPKAGGYPLTKMTGKSYCTASKFSNMKATFKSRSATVGGPPIEGYEDLNTVDQVQSSCPSLSPKAAAAAAEVEASTTEHLTKIKDIASRAAEVMADKINTDTIPGLNITCPSGDKPKISYIRNSKFAKGAKDVNTLKGVKGCKNELSCSEPSENQYIFNPLTEY